MKIQDLIVIGGGINGAGIAWEATRQGLRVTLCESQDLGQETSSKSSKLIHGGLRYLEHYAFKLVKESLHEREQLMQLAPQLIKPQRFLIPHIKQIRPFWLLKLGLWLYDYLSPKKSLPASGAYKLKPTDGLTSEYTKALSYYDCTTDDTRLVIELAKDAYKMGANILTHCEVVHAKRLSDFWEITYKNHTDKKMYSLRARCLVNATGTHAIHFLNQVLKISSDYHLSWIKGSHIVVPRQVEHQDAFLLQHSDKRVIFVIPYLQEFSLIGTTDIAVNTLPKVDEVQPEEIHYLLDIYNRYFEKKIDTADIVWKYSGVRALCGKLKAKPQEVSRDYILETHQSHGLAPALSVLGGKLTTFRSLSMQVVQKLKPFYPFIYYKNTKLRPLCGGLIPTQDLKAFQDMILNSYSKLPQVLLLRLIQLYGSQTPEVLGRKQEIENLGIHFGAHLYQQEVEYLVNNEWALTAEDILWRRTKLGLYFKPDEVQALELWLKNKQMLVDC